MDEKKFCFITCIKNKEYYDECLYYINDLNIPEGYDVEIISIQAEIKMAEGYNEAIKESSAKYKIYLHENTFIVNKNFLYDILSIFKNNQDIGMIGVMGSKCLPLNDSWKHSINNYGKMYDTTNGSLKKVCFNDIDSMYTEAKIIDGAIMVTQYDLPWKSDIFDGKYYFDISECIEFSKAGYKIVIPKQDNPWVIHDFSSYDEKEHNKYKNIYLDTYYKEIMPLVSIVINTSGEKNQDISLLESAINQTYRNIEIIVINNNSDDNIKNAFREYQKNFKNIIYYDNELFSDYDKLNIAKGEYVYFLSNNYTIESDAVDKMMQYYIQDLAGDAALVLCNYNKKMDYICNKETSGKSILSEILLNSNYDLLSYESCLFNRKILLKTLDYKSSNNISFFELLFNNECILINSDISSQILKKQLSTYDNLYTYCNIVLNDKTYKLLDEDDSKYLDIINNAINNINKYLNINDDRLNKFLVELNKYRDTIKEKIPMLSVVIDNSNGNIELDKIMQSINNFYSNNEFIIINDKDESMRYSKNDDIKLYVYSKILTINENIDRAMHNMKGQYFLFIDEENYNFISQDIKCMMNYHIKNDLAVVIKGINCNKDECIEGQNFLKYIVQGIANLADNKYIYIINKSYYINQIGTYFNGKFTCNKNLATICSALRLGNAEIISGQQEKIDQSDNNKISRYLEILDIVKLIKNEKYLDSILDYQKAVKSIFDKVNNLIQKNNWQNLNSKLEKFKNFYEIDTKEFEFCDYGFNTVIREGAEVIRGQAISIGSNTLIKEDSTLMIPYDNFEGKPRIIIGDNCDIGKRIFISAVNKVTIEDQVITASNIHIADHNHNYLKVGIPIRLQGVDSYKNEVKIGYGSWIGNNCVIVGNVKIGRGCTIGANSVVTSDIPDYSVAVGKPAKVIKYFDINEYKWKKVTDENEYNNYLKKIKKPLLTIGIPTWNRSGFLDRCLKNIYSEIGNDEMIQVIVSDNDSNDATRKITEKYKKVYKNIRYNKNDKNLGLMGNTRKVYEISDGKYITAHGDDDYYRYGIIYTVVHNLIENNGCSLAYALPANQDNLITCGNGIDKYVQKVSFMSTFVTSLFMNNEEYKKIQNKTKYDGTELDLVYFQMELLKNNNKFIVMENNYYNDESGQHKQTGNPYNFGKVFIEYYLNILLEYLDNGLSLNVLEDEKVKLLNTMVIPWIEIIKSDLAELKIDNLVQIFTRYYKDEPYFEQKLQEIESKLGYKGEN